MAFKYLLDTNILSELVRHPQGLIFNHIKTVGEENICTSIIVASELRFGAAKRHSSKLSQQIERILDAITVLSFEAPVDRQYASIRNHLEKAGTPIGPNDMLIAAHALSLGLTLVTANTNEFQRIPKLNVENWLN